MDAVITYVDGLDPKWQESYSKTLNVPVLEKRFRDWGTLKYLLRGIQKYMPFVDKVHLVVALDSQVPAWVDRNEVDVVLHSDIIPQDKLPLFSSASIELFLHKIPGLSEEYIYFNDDFFPVAPSFEEDFFVEGRPQISLAKHIVTGNMFKKQVKAASDFARKAAGLRKSLIFRRPQHIAAPMLKSVCDELFDSNEAFLLGNVSPIRRDDSLCQYIYTDYVYYIGKTDRKRLSNKHFSLAAASAEKIAAFLDNPTAKFACINDVTMTEEKYLKTREILLDAFERHLPEKSRFEI